jgi:RNA polymerase sigma-70 factor, ECF subfamily
MTGEQWRRKRQRSQPVSSAHAGRGGLPRRGAGSHEPDGLRELREQPIGDASEQVVDRHLMIAALCRLTQEHRDVLIECCFRGRSVEQAAHALGIAPGAVKSRTYYALRALRLAIEELRGVE